MKSLRNLLHQVKIINDKNTEILDARGGRFNIFSICGVNHYENTHSAIITELLNPDGKHGLKCKLLECFIETLGEYFTIQDFNCERARVYTEYSTEEGRIDILIKDHNNKAIIIENKIHAKDQPEQLKRYDKHAQTYKNGYQILYLTLQGDQASDQSGAEVDYISISHKEHIVNWLEKCVGITSRFPIVRETIIQYINHLKQLTNQDMDTKNQEEITKVLSDIDNLRAAKVIANNYSATFDYIIEKHFNQKMEEFAQQKGLEYHYEKSEESYVRFHFTKSDWKGEYWIGFTFESNRCHYGLCNNPNNINLSTEKRKELHEQLKELGVAPRKESLWWPFYSQFPPLSLEVWEKDIINSDHFLNDCITKTETLLGIMEKINL